MEAPGERLAKRIAHSGLCSRREAEKLIAQGAVRVDGKVVLSPAINVTSLHRITVKGKALEEDQPTRLWRYYKPTGLLTTHRDPEGRPTLFDQLPAHLPRVVSVGRLDLNSEGLILLTTDGGLARHLSLPATGWVRRYRVRVHGRADKAAFASLAKGITVDGVRYAPIQVEVERSGASNIWLRVALTEGKNREIRKVFEHLGMPVSRLIRVAYGPFELGDLEKGAACEVPRAQLKTHLGPHYQVR